MQVFKLYMQILFKKKSTLLVYLILFSVIWFGLSGANTKDLNKEDTAFRNTQITLAYIDKDQSDLSQCLTDYLKDTTKVKKIANDEQSLKDAIYFMEVNYIITIPEGFEKHFYDQDSDYQLVTQKKPNTAESFLAEQQVEKYLNAMYSYKKSAPDLSYQQVHKQITAALAQQTKVSIPAKNSLSFNQEKAIMYFNTLAYILLAVIILLASTIMNCIFKREVHIRTLASPLTNLSFNLQLFLANICFGLGIWLFFMLLNITVNDNMLSQQGLLFGFNALTMTLIALSFAFMCTNLLRGMRNQMDAINGITNVFALGSCFVGGNFIPQEMLPKAVLDFASFLPNYWYVKINDLIPHFDGSSWSTLLQGFGIQWLFVIAFFMAGLVISRFKQSSRKLS